MNFFNLTLKQFMIAFALIVGLVNSIIMLWTFYNIFIADGNFVRAEVMVGETNMWVYSIEVFCLIYATIFLSLILFKGDNIKRIAI